MHLAETGESDVSFLLATKNVHNASDLVSIALSKTTMNDEGIFPFASIQHEESTNITQTDL